MMEQISLDGLRLYYEVEEREASEVVRRACERTLFLVRDTWGLGAPAECRVYVMTSWVQFLLHSSPWYWKIPLALFLPLWVLRVRRYWRVAGGWTQRYGKRIAVGVKPPRIIEQADRSLGERIFVKEEDLQRKMEQITCHELTHALTSHLNLPMWLNEGVAMVMVDHYVGDATVKQETLQALQPTMGGESPGSYRSVSPRDRDALVYHSVRGYWITRYIEDTRPELLKGLFSKCLGHHVVEEKIASAYGMNREDFWAGIDGLLVAHFQGEFPTNSENDAPASGLKRNAAPSA
jgi:hypothetical protein